MTPPPILVLLSFFLLLAMSVFLMARKVVPATHSARTETSMNVSVMMQVVISLVALAAGIYVIVNHSYATGAKEWGYGIVGTVVGYWLRAGAKP